MDQAVLDIVQNGLTLEGALLIVQLILVAFAVLWIRSWILKTLAWNIFRRSTVMGVGTKVTVTVNGTFCVDGIVRKADKNRVVIRTGNKFIYVPTTQFIKDAWTIHDHGGSA